MIPASRMSCLRITPGAPLNMAYITKVNGAWTGPVLLNTGATTFNRDASIGYTRANGTLTLHAVVHGRQIRHRKQ